MRKNKKILSILLAIIFIWVNINSYSVKAETSKKKTGYITSSEEQLFQRERSKNSLNKSYNEKSYSRLPSRYNAVDYDEITGVKNQGAIGCCWAFSAYGAIEANLKKNTGESYDFSEIHMADNNGIVKPNSGGNFWHSFAYLLSGKGPVLEKDSPYPWPATVENINTNKNAKVNYKVNQMEYLPTRNTKTDNDYIKKSVLNYGAVGCCIRISDCDYLSDDGKYLYNPDDNELADHAVLIVGWDDSISKEKFRHTPEGDGAFICKNSWGETQNDGGYFYVSYYDSQIGRNLAIYDDIEKLSPYEKVTNYSSFTDSKTEYINFNRENYYGTIFTADEDINLNSISIKSIFMDVNYKVYVEEDYDANGFNNILNKQKGEGSFENSGAHNVKLNNPVKIKKGKRYFICIGSNEGVIFSNKGDSKGTENSFVKTDTGWQKTSGCFPLSIYTSKVLENEVKSISLDKSSLNLNGGETCKLNINFTPSNTADKTVNWKTSDSDIVSVSEDGVVKAKRNGQAVVTAYTPLGNIKSSCTINVTNAFKISNINGYNEGDLLSNDVDLKIIFNDFVQQGKEKPYFIDEENKKHNCYYDIRDNMISIHINKEENYVGGDLKLVIPKNSFLDSKGMVLRENNEFIFKSPIGYKEKIDFKDKSFESKIRKSIGKESGNISSTDMLKLTTLWIEDENVWDLSGIEYAENLNEVILSTNIYDIKPLSKLKNITNLYITQGNIKDLNPLKEMKSLKYLSLGNINADDYSVIGELNNLETLTLYRTSIKNIDFIPKLENLKALELRNNLIENISGLGSYNIINSLELQGNQIKDINPLLDMCRKNFSVFGYKYIDISDNLINESVDIKSKEIIEEIKSEGFDIYNSSNKENFNIMLINGVPMVDGGMNIEAGESIELEFSQDVKINDNEKIYICDSNNERINVSIDVDKNKIYLNPEREINKDKEYTLYFDENSIEGMKEKAVYLQSNKRIRGDVNSDNEVDIKDLALAANDYNVSLKTAGLWNINEDCVKDGIIDIYDISVISSKIK